MATTLVGGTFTATITTTITINGKDRGCTNTYSVANVLYHDVRTMQVPAGGEIDILAFVAAGTAIGAGKFVDATVKWLQIWNKNDTRDLRFRLVNTGAEVADVNIPPGGRYCAY